MSPPDGNGWTRYEQLVLFRLDKIESRLDSLSHEVQETVSSRRSQYLRVGVLSFSVAAATAFGSRVAWDMLLKMLF